MPKLVVTLDGATVKELPLRRDRTTLGRRPYNDIVIDHLGVSGEHAAFVQKDGEVWVEDLGSTNGSYVDGHPVKKQKFGSGETLEIGKFRIRLVADVEDKPRQRVEPTATATASIKVVSGPGAGIEMPITKVVTTIGKSGQVIAAITRGMQGYSIAHIEGSGHFVVNGSVVGAESVVLKRGDTLELGATKMQFVQ